MRDTFLALSAMSAAAVVQIRPSPEIDRPVVITVDLGQENKASFRVSQRDATEIDLHVRGAEYSVPLQCARKLRDVDFGTVELWQEKAFARHRDAAGRLGTGARGSRGRTLATNPRRTATATASCRVATPMRPNSFTNSASSRSSSMR